MAYHHITIGNYTPGRNPKIPPFSEEYRLSTEELRNLKKNNCLNCKPQVESEVSININNLAY